MAIHKLTLRNCNTVPDGPDAGTIPDKKNSTNTTVNTAFLSPHSAGDGVSKYT
jgi:hypothetical protein